MSSRRRTASRAVPSAAAPVVRLDPLEPRRLLASVANKIADINQGSVHLSPQNFAPLGATNVTMFAGKSHHGDGYELWRTDGTAAGTRRVRDIRPGTAESNPSNLTDVNGTLYFTADDGVNGVELWRSDGTEAGTTLVRDVVPGGAGASPTSLIAANGKLFFTAAGGVWSSDGTAAGTLRAGTAGYTFPTYRSYEPGRGIAALNGVVYFGANTGLYRTDGTAAGTTLVRALHAAPRQLVAFDGRVFFNGDQDVSNRGDLWATDGTAAGTTMVKAIGTANYSSVRNFAASGGLLYFIAGEVLTGAHQLWRTDGTNANTVSLSSTLVDGNTVLTPFAGQSVLFSGRTAATGAELYRSDGTGAPALVRDVLPGSGDGAGGAPVRFGSTYYLIAGRADGGSQIWRTDGTNAGTTLVSDLGGQFVWAVGGNAASGQLLLSLTSAAGLGELWKSDGTAAGTARVGTSHAIGNGSSMWDYWTTSNDGRAFTPWGTSVLFAADDGVNGSEPWITNPQTATTRRLADVNPGLGSSNPNQFTPASDGSVLFQATTPATGAELYRVSPSGLVQLAADVLPGAAGGAATRLRAFGSSVYFGARVVADGPLLLHRYDVATLANVAVRDAANARLTGATPLRVVGTVAYFSAATEASPDAYALYVVTAPGATPVRLKTLNVDDNGIAQRTATLGSTLYFVATDGASGYELWKTDGTVAGTAIVRDVNPGLGSGGIDELVAFGGKVFFNASPTDGVTTLWSSDGTAAGTAEYAAASTATAPYAFAVVSDDLYFVGTAADGVTNVFRSGGGGGGSGGAPTPIVAGATSGLRPVMTHGAGQTLFYVMQDSRGATRAFSLAQFTPSDDATTRVKDLWQYNPLDATLASTWGLGRSGFLATGNRLYFPAFRTEWGVEPHAYVIDPIATQIGGDVYWDRDRNGARGANDVAAPNVTVYVDLDADRARDADEPTAVTDAGGNYAFRHLDYGTYVVRPLAAAGQAQTEPANGAGATMTIPNGAAATGSGRIGLVDGVAPRVAAVAFDRDAPRMRVRVEFDEAIDPATLAAADLTLIDLATGAALPANAHAVAYEAASRSARFTFPAYANGALPDGRYRATFAAGAAADAFGNPTPTAIVVEFHVLAGDVNGDGAVGFADLVVVAQHYGTSGRTFAQGNVDYDAAGTVDFADLVLLAQRYGRSLSLATTTTTASVAAPARKARGSVSRDVLGG